MKTTGENIGNTNGSFLTKELSKRDKNCLFKKLMKTTGIVLMIATVLFAAGIYVSQHHFGIAEAPNSTSAPGEESVPAGQNTTALPTTVNTGDISWVPAEGLMAPSGYTGKIAYLTFDDGPSLSRTTGILDILNAYKINATFFLIGENILPENYSIIKRAYNEGHVIGNHTYDHLTAGSSLEHFKDSVNKTAELIEQITGKQPECFRFPGGSSAAHMKNVMKYAGTWLHKNGYEYFDWNTSTGDGNVQLAYSAEQLCANALKFSNEEHLIVLMHDSSIKADYPHDTAGAVPLIIHALYNRGYKFGVLTRDTPTVHFR